MNMNTTRSHVPINPNPLFPKNFPFFSSTLPKFISFHFEFEQTNRMPISNSLKPFKFLVLRPIDIFAPFLRAVLVISAVASFSLFFYLTFSDQKPHCRGCYDAHGYSNHRKVKALAAGDHQPTNISHIVFGIGGSVKTWNERRHYCELWWKKNVTRGFVWLEEKPEFPWPESSPPYKISDDTSKFNYTCWYY